MTSTQFKTIHKGKIQAIHKKQFNLSDFEISLDVLEMFHKDTCREFETTYRKETKNRDRYIKENVCSKSSNYIFEYIKSQFKISTWIEIIKEPFDYFNSIKTLELKSFHFDFIYVYPNYRDDNVYDYFKRLSMHSKKIINEKIKQIKKTIKIVAMYENSNLFQ